MTGCVAPKVNFLGARRTVSKVGRLDAVLHGPAVSGAGREFVGDVGDGRLMGGFPLFTPAPLTAGFTKVS